MWPIRGADRGGGGEREGRWGDEEGGKIEEDRAMLCYLCNIIVIYTLCQ